MSTNCRGHTLIELLVAMTLSMLIVIALVTVNILSLKSILQIQQIEKQINLLSQSLQLIETDVKSTAVTACAMDKNLVLDSLTRQTASRSVSTQFNWISGYSSNSWFPETPNFASDKLSKTFDAIQIARADMLNPLSYRAVKNTPKRIVFITDCIVSEIARSMNSILLKRSSSPSDLAIYSFQMIQYYIRENSGNYTLYRQYLSKNGRTVNEPLVDNIAELTIGYGEQLSDTTLAFNTAANINNWNAVIAVYISITITGALYRPLSKLVLLNNYAARH